MHAGNRLKKRKLNGAVTVKIMWFRTFLAWHFFNFVQNSLKKKQIFFANAFHIYLVSFSNPFWMLFICSSNGSFGIMLHRIYVTPNLRWLGQALVTHYLRQILIEYTTFELCSERLETILNQLISSYASSMSRTFSKPFLYWPLGPSLLLKTIFMFGNSLTCAMHIIIFYLGKCPINCQNTPGT